MFGSSSSHGGGCLRSDRERREGEEPCPTARPGGPVGSLSVGGLSEGLGGLHTGEDELFEERDFFDGLDLFEVDGEAAGAVLRRLGGGFGGPSYNSSSSSILS